MSDKDKMERRKYVRLDTEVKIDCVPLKGEKTRISAVTRNISVQGVCFTSDKEFKLKTPLKISVFIPHYWQPIQLKGKVVWSRPVESKDPNEGPKFDTGVKLSEIEKSNESKFFMYVLDKVVERYSRKMDKEK
ncbi:MAG: PilZ domain-containing protein [bacterium]